MRPARSFWDWLLGWTHLPAPLRADVDELRNDPVERLARAPVMIGRFRAWPLVVLTPAIVFWLVRHEFPNALWPASAAAGVTLLCVVAWVRSMPDALRLESDGILFRRRGVEIVCGWELFAVVGHPFRAGWWVVLPADPAAVDLVGMWRKGKIVAEGDTVRTAFFRFDAPDQVRLATGLRLGPHDLGELLLHVANLLCQPVESAAAEESSWPRPLSGAMQTLAADSVRAESEQPSLPAAVIDWGGRVRMSCTRLLFPPECCICGQATLSSLRLRAPGRLGVLPTRSHVDFDVPCCPRCARGEVWRSRAAFVFPALLNFAAWTGLLFVVTGWSWREWPWAAGLAGLLSLLTLWLAVTAGDWLLGRVWATYLAHQHELELRFQRMEYAQRVVEYLALLQTSGKGRSSPSRAR